MRNEGRAVLSTAAKGREDGGSFAGLSDVELCARVAAAGSDSEDGRAAYAELYRRYRDAALSRAVAAARPPVSPEDVVSEAFAKTLQAMDRGLGPRDSFVGYLFTAIRSEGRRRTKMEGVTDLVADDELDVLASASVEDAAERHGDLDQLQRAFASLPGDWQQLLWLVEVEGIPQERAATRIGATPSAMISRLARAREALRTAYLQQYVDRAPVGCGEAPTLLAGFVRGSLGKRQHRAVQAHAEECAECAEQARRLRTLNEQLRSWLGPVVVGAAAAGGGAAVGSAAPASAVEGSRMSAAHAVAGGERIPAVWVWGSLGGAAVLLVFGLLLLLSPGDAAPADGDPSPTPATVEQRPADEPEPLDDEEGPGEGGDAVDAGPPQDSADPSRPAQAGGDDRTPHWRLLEDRLKHLREK